MSGWMGDEDNCRQRASEIDLEVFGIMSMNVRTITKPLELCLDIQPQNYDVAERHLAACAKSCSHNGSDEVTLWLLGVGLRSRGGV